MWNLISCSKLTEERIKQKSYDNHVSKIKRMKSKIKIIQPDQPWFVYIKSKKQLARMQQLKNIDKNNTILLSKIRTIQTRENQTFKNTIFLKTLNSKIMNDQNQKIFKENQRICEKIMKTQAHYKTQNIILNTINLEKVMNNISSNSRRVQSAKFIANSKSKITTRPQSSATKRPMSSYSVNQFRTPCSTDLKQQLQSNQNSARKVRAFSAQQLNKRKIQQNNQVYNNEETLN